MRALIYGSWNIDAIVSVLLRSGFDIDLVTASKQPVSRHGKLVRFHCERPAEIIEQVRRLCAETDYDFVQPLDDFCLRQAVDAACPPTEKLGFLPVCRVGQIAQLGSKIGLAHLLAGSQVRFPPALAAQDAQSLTAAAERLGFPLVAKADRSQGGNGTYLVRNAQDLRRLCRGKLRYPVLCQRYIAGDHLGIEALYHEGRLVHFACARVEGNIGGHAFAISNIRRYLGQDAMPPDTRDQLSALGLATGLCGMVSVGAMVERATGLLYIFEADARANPWFAHARLFGQGFEPHLGAPQADLGAPLRLGQTVCVPRRMPLTAVIMNRHAAWRCAMVNDPALRDLPRMLSGNLLERMRAEFRRWRAARRKLAARLRLR